jgi:hypothetical protein
VRRDNLSNSQISHPRPKPVHRHGEIAAVQDARGQRFLEALVSIPSAQGNIERARITLQIRELRGHLGEDVEILRVRQSPLRPADQQKGRSWFPRLRPVGFNPNSEIENGRDSTVRGAHASGVWFSASRRKQRSTNFFTDTIPDIMWDGSSGATPEHTRETRVLPIPISGFALNATPINREQETPSGKVATQGRKNLMGVVSK